MYIFNGKKLKAFTLVELAIVLLVIGLLVSSVLVGKDIIDRAKVQSIYSEATSIEKAVVMFKDSYGALPGYMSHQECTNYSAFRPSILTLGTEAVGPSKSGVDHTYTNLSKCGNRDQICLATDASGNCTNRSFNTPGNINYPTTGSSIERACYGMRALSWSGFVSNVPNSENGQACNYFTASNAVLKQNMKLSKFSNDVGVFVAPIDQQHFDFISKELNHSDASAKFPYGSVVINFINLDTRLAAVTSDLMEKLDVKFDDGLAYTGNITGLKPAGSVAGLNPINTHDRTKWNNSTVACTSTSNSLFTNTQNLRGSSTELGSRYQATSPKSLSSGCNVMIRINTSN